MLYRLRQLGLTCRVYEAGSDIGGTWFWNRYPGARCDIETIDYSYSFSEELEQEWVWTERYASQAEILTYIHHVAERFDLRRDIQLGTRVTAAAYQEPANEWLVETEHGERVACHYLILAVGCLSAANLPPIPGLETFQGRWYHTGNWPHEPVDFSGQRVGVIGTGSSGIQSIPRIAEQAEELVVFQRTPNFSIPARNRPLPPEDLDAVKARYQERRALARADEKGFLVTTSPISDQPALAVDPELREAEFEAHWASGGFSFLSAFNDLSTDLAANQTAADFVRTKIRTTVQDPGTAERLTPKDHPIGAKRLCLDTGYYETYNQPHVTLVDVRETPIETITTTGLRTSAQHYPLDSLVFATGYDAVTGAVLGIEIQGRHGQRLADTWADGPRTYLGLMTAGFPNLFMITGPGSPSILTNVIVSIEQHVEWVAGCIDYLEERGLAGIEATETAQAAWGEEVEAAAAETLYPLANSWYVGANVEGKPRAFLPYAGGVPKYRAICDEVVAKGYAGFTLLSPAST
jgi:cyclohexanone monooxygenase